MGAGVLALALTGRVVESTADLVRLLRTPSAAAAIVDAGTVEAAASVLPPLPDASRTIEPPPAPEIARLISRNQEDDERVVPNVAARDADVLDARTADADGSDGAEVGAPADAASPVEASLRPEPRGTAGAVGSSPRLATAGEPIRCGWRTCAQGQVCCSWNCAICALPGETCSNSCGAPAAPVSAMCGPHTCNVTEFCCNPSCGICVPMGGAARRKSARACMYLSAPRAA
jgi:hypothetical protein